MNKYYLITALITVSISNYAMETRVRLVAKRSNTQNTSEIFVTINRQTNELWETYNVTIKKEDCEDYCHVYRPLNSKNNAGYDNSSTFDYKPHVRLIIPQLLKIPIVDQFKMLEFAIKSESHCKEILKILCPNHNNFVIRLDNKSDNNN